MKYLVDTSWTVGHLRGNEEVSQRLLYLGKEGLAVSIISVAELYEGIFRSRNPLGDESKLTNFLSGVTVLGINEEICKVFGRERARLRQSGVLIGDLDLLIASTALYYSLTLLTADRDFEMVESLTTIFT